MGVFRKMPKKLNKLRKVIEALTQLVLAIGTLLATVHHLFF